jgi:hypothetical protein
MRSATQEMILTGVHAFMKPLASFLLRSGIGFREFAEVCKFAFVEVATSQYGIRGRPTNISRVAVMTGLTRKEVKFIREKIDQGFKDRLPIGRPYLPTQILHYWYNDPDFCTSSGKPKPLPMSGSFPSFTDLVRRYAGDIPPGAMRVELTRTAGVIEDNDGMLCPTKRHYISQELDEQLLRTISFSLANLAKTIDHNVATKGQNIEAVRQRLERYVWTSELSPDDGREFEEVAEKKAEKLLGELDDWIGQREQSRLQEGRWSPDLQGHQPYCGLGVYFFKKESSDR